MVTMDDVEAGLADFADYHRQQVRLDQEAANRYLQTTFMRHCRTLDEWPADVEPERRADFEYELRRIKRELMRRVHPELGL